MNEQILIKLGLDSTAFTRAMAGLRGVATRAAQSIGSAFSGGFGAIVSGGAVLLGLQKAIQLADQLKTTSESLNISTDFLQGFQKFAQDNGASIETANKALTFLSRTIGEATNGSKEAIDKLRGIGVTLLNANGTFKDTAEVVGEISDKLKGSTSGAEQSRIAFEGFGKGAITLVAGLRQGSAAMKEFIDQSSKLSTGQINALDNLGDTLQRWSANVIVGFASVGEGAALLFETFSRAFREHISFGEAAKRIGVEARAAAEDAKKLNDQLKQAEAFGIARREHEASRVAEEKADAEEVSAKWARENEEAQKNILVFQKAQTDAIRTQNAIKNAQHERGRFTLEELANLQAPSGGFIASQSRNVSAAQRALLLESQARFNLAAGRDDVAGQRFAAADAIRASLTPLLGSERKPFGELEKATKESSNTLGKILSVLALTGVTVISDD